MHGNGDLNHVAVGEGQRQLDLAEEVFLHGQVVARLAGQGLDREALGEELPGGRAFGHGQSDRRRAVGAGGDGRVPVAGFLRQQGGEQDRAGRIELRGQGLRRFSSSRPFSPRRTLRYMPELSITTTCFWFWAIRPLRSPAETRPAAVDLQGTVVQDGRLDEIGDTIGGFGDRRPLGIVTFMPMCQSWNPPFESET